MFARRSKPAPAPVVRAARAVLDKLESRVLFVAVAEALLVDVDATALPQGPVTSVANNGTLGGVFTPGPVAGEAPVIGRPLATADTGTSGIRFDGNDFLQLVAEVGGALRTAPAGITGANPTHSVEAWVWNPGIPGEETVLAWGKREGPDGSNASFNYGNDARWGALGRWGASDIGWGPTVPAASKWHHLAWTFDGTTQRVYVDGVKVNEELNVGAGGSGALNIHPDTPVLLGAQATGALAIEPGLRASSTIAKARVHDGVLTDAQVLANYNEEKAAFVEPGLPPPPPPKPPVLLVDIDPTTLPEGPVESIPNAAPLGGSFMPTGGGTTGPSIDQPLPASTTGTRGIRLDGNDFLQHVDEIGALQPAPASITGVDPQNSIEVWVYNPSTAPEETMLSWSRRGGPDGSNYSFNYGDNPDYGALGHWGGADMGWGPTVPAPRQWHHLVQTYDGRTTRVYVDGVLANSEALEPGALNIHPNLPINIGTQIEGNGATPTPILRGDLTLGRVRVYEGLLTPAQIAANYNAEKAGYVEPDEGPAALSSPPINRYTFSNPAGPAASETVIEDVIGNADAILKGAGATFTGSRVTLPGGSSATAAYIDLPNAILSSKGVDNAGTGQITLEGWTRHTGNHFWGRFFDLGTSTAGELQAPGGTGEGRNYWMLSQFENSPTLHRTEMIVAGGNPSNRTEDVDAPPFQTDIHWAATWNELSGEVTLYEQGVEVSKISTPLFFTSIADVNNWLGRSNYTGDGNFQGEYDEFRIYDRVLTAQEVQGNFQAGADVVTGGTPVVTEVYVRSSRWAGQDNNPGTTTFMEYLEAKGLGDDVMGYRLYGAGRTPSPLNPEDIIPWVNADQIVVRYSSPPSGAGVPTPGTLSVAGRNPAASPYTVTSVTPVPGNPSAFVLQLNKPLGGGNPTAGTAPTTSENGDVVTLGVPGGGPAGGTFSFGMKVLQGDTDHLSEGADHVVLARDYSEIKKKFFKDTDDVPAGTDADYTPFHDVDGSGSILAGDYSEVKKRFFQSLTLPPPAAADMFGALRIAEEVLK